MPWWLRATLEAAACALVAVVLVVGALVTAVVSVPGG